MLKNMSRYFLLFLPVIFSTAAQLLIKHAAFKELRSIGWYVAIGWSIIAYFLAFALYSVAVRHFAISVASPVNTISVMLLVVLGGVVFWGESFGLRQVCGLSLGIFALLLLLSGD